MNKGYNVTCKLATAWFDFPKESKVKNLSIGLRWNQLNPLWGRGSGQLIANRPIKIRYIEELLKWSLEEGVQYLETRKSLRASERIYVLDSEATNGTGKIIIDDNDGELDILLTLEVWFNEFQTLLLHMVKLFFEMYSLNSLYWVAQIANIHK